MTEQKPCNPPQHRSKKSVKQQQKQRKKDQIFFFFSKWDLFSEKAHTQHAFNAWAVLCVGHFGSAVTILDKRVVLWSQNGGGFFLPLKSTHLLSSVGASAGCLWGGEESECVM